MPKTESTILAYWPELEEDLGNFLADTDAWIISELKKAGESKDWGKIQKIIGVMELVHGLAHEH